MKEVTKRASIIFVFYNNFDEAEPTFASIEEQDCAGEDVELILSDDGSTKYDRSLLEKAAERMRSRYPQVKVNLMPENVGTVAHLNRTFQIAEGKYYVFCSPGDRFPEKNTVSNILSRFEKGGELILTGRRRDVGEKGSRIMPPALLGPALRICPRLLMNYRIRRHNLISSCCTSYSRELIERYGGPDEDYRLLDDFPYFVSLLQKGVRFGFTEEIFLEHSVGGGVSTGQSIHPLILKDLELMQEKLLREPTGLYASPVSFLRKQIEDRA